jgi:hypothetical protein
MQNNLRGLGAVSSLELSYYKQRCHGYASYFNLLKYIFWMRKFFENAVKRKANSEPIANSSARTVAHNHEQIATSPEPKATNSTLVTNRAKSELTSFSNPVPMAINTEIENAKDEVGIVFTWGSNVKLI